MYYDRLEEEEYYLDMFRLTQDFLVYCKNDQISDIYDLSVDVVKNQLLSKKCSIEDCSTNWKSKKKKSVVDSYLCVDNCSSISYYEYNNQCYKNCPEGTNSSEKDLYLCKIIPKKVEKETETSTYINDDNFYEKLEDKYILNYFKIYQDYAKDIINKIKNGKMDYIISDITNNNKSDYFINYNNIQFQITTLYNQKKAIYSNLSTIIIEEEC